MSPPSEILSSEPCGGTSLRLHLRVWVVAQVSANSLALDMDSERSTDTEALDSPLPGGPMGFPGSAGRRTSKSRCSSRADSRARRGLLPDVSRASFASSTSNVSSNLCIPSPGALLMLPPVPPPPPPPPALHTHPAGFQACSSTMAVLAAGCHLFLPPPTAVCQALAFCLDPQHRLCTSWF